MAAADESLINQRIVAYGGYNSIVATTQQLCLNGASGTIYMKKSNYLSIVANNDDLNYKTSRKTPLDSADPNTTLPPNLFADGPVNISPT